MTSRAVFLSLALVFALGCEGPTGPEGPPGDDAMVDRLVFEGDLDATGSASVDLPPEAGTIKNPPLVSCYVSYGSSSWAALGSGGPGSLGLCLLVDRTTNLEVLIQQASSFGKYKVIAIY